MPSEEDVVVTSFLGSPGRDSDQLKKLMPCACLFTQYKPDNTVIADMSEYMLYRRYFIV